MILNPQGWVKPVIPIRVLTAQEKSTIKASIKSFVTVPKKSRDIIDYIQDGLEGPCVNDDTILSLLREVDAEWNPVETPEEL